MKCPKCGLDMEQNVEEFDDHIVREWTCECGHIEFKKIMFADMPGGRL